MKTILIMMLGLGFIPVIVKPFSLKVKYNDGPDVIRYKMELIGVKSVEIARELKISESTIVSAISNRHITKRNKIVDQINKRVK